MAEVEPPATARHRTSGAALFATLDGTAVAALSAVTFVAAAPVS